MNCDIVIDSKSIKVIYVTDPIDCINIKNIILNLSKDYDVIDWRVGPNRYEVHVQDKK